MSRLVTKLCCRLRGEVEGVVAVEYAVIAGAIAIALSAAMLVYGPAILRKFTNLGNILPG